MIPDAYTILIARSAGNITLTIISFIGFGLFFFGSYPNGISRWFALCLLFLGIYSAMVCSTGLVIVFANTSTQAQLDFFYWFWLREVLSVWSLNLAIIALGIYLLRHKDD